MDNKVVKYIVIGLAPIALILGVWYWWSSGSASPIPSSAPFVDVVTGEIITLSQSEVRTIPSANKRDGKRTLYPVVKDESGNYVIGERYRDDFAAMAQKMPVKVDTTTFKVQTTK